MDQNDLRYEHDSTGFWVDAATQSGRVIAKIMNEANVPQNDMFHTNGLPMSSEQGVWEVGPRRRCWSLRNQDFILF